MMHTGLPRTLAVQKRGVMQRLRISVRRWLQSGRNALADAVYVATSQEGQTTAEYALVILGAAAIGTLLITWATKSHAVGKLFDEVVGKILP